MGAANGRYFEDFRPGERFQHAVPRTLTDGDAAFYLALTGDRSPLYSSDEFARALGLPRRPLHDLLVFNAVFAKADEELGVNSIANLGFAELRFQRPVFAGDTLRAVSALLGLREASSGAAGVVWLRTTGYNQRDQPVLSFIRWLMVAKRDPSANCEDTATPQTDRAVPPASLAIPGSLRIGSNYPAWATGPRFLEDYQPGERIDHVHGVTIGESEQALATRFYQNPARSGGHAAATSRAGRPAIYGGHVLSVARSISFKGLENGLACLAWDACANANPVYAGDTLYALSEVTGTVELPGRDDAGGLRLRLVALKNLPVSSGEGSAFPLRRLDEKTGRESYHPSVVLDLEQVLLMPRRSAAGG